MLSVAVSMEQELRSLFECWSLCDCYLLEVTYNLTCSALSQSYEEYLARMTGAAGGYPPEGAYPGEYGRPPYAAPEEMYVSSKRLLMRTASVVKKPQALAERS